MKREIFIDDNDNWIAWFCYETDFGNKSYRLQAYNENKKPIKMNNAADLYDFLKNA